MSNEGWIVPFCINLWKCCNMLPAFSGHEKPCWNFVAKWCQYRFARQQWLDPTSLRSLQRFSNCCWSFIEKTVPLLIYDGWTPLHWASNGGHAATVEHLLRNGADMNRIDKCGNSPLKLATICVKTEVFQILKKFGASLWTFFMIRLNFFGSGYSTNKKLFAQSAIWTIPI